MPAEKYKFTLCLCREENKNNCQCKVIECTEEQKLFAFHYANGKNGKDSYRLASNKNCCKERYKVYGSIYRNDDTVKELIKYYQRLNGLKYLNEYESIINNLYHRANVDPLNMYDEDGKLLKLSEMDQYTRKAVKVKYKSRKATKTEEGVFYQPTLFGDSYDAEIEYDPKISHDAEIKLLQLMGKFENEENN